MSFHNDILRIQMRVREGKYSKIWKSKEPISLSKNTGHVLLASVCCVSFQLRTTLFILHSQHSMITTHPQGKETPHLPYVIIPISFPFFVGSLHKSWVTFNLQTYIIKMELEYRSLLFPLSSSRKVIDLSGSDSLRSFIHVFIQ